LLVLLRLILFQRAMSAPQTCITHLPHKSPEPLETKQHSRSPGAWQLSVVPQLERLA
jgi:hypothetical protein